MQWTEAAADSRRYVHDTDGQCLANSRLSKTLSLLSISRYLRKRVGVAQRQEASESVQNLLWLRHPRTLSHINFRGKLLGAGARTHDK